MKYAPKIFYIFLKNRLTLLLENQQQVEFLDMSLKQTKANDPFGLVMTIYSDDEVEDLDLKASTKSASSKSTKLSKKDIAGTKFYSSISEDNFVPNNLYIKRQGMSKDDSDSDEYEEEELVSEDENNTKKSISQHNKLTPDVTKGIDKSSKEEEIAEEEVEVEEIEVEDNEYMENSHPEEDEAALEEALNKEIFELQQKVSNVTFHDLKLSKKLLQGVHKLGFFKPTPIQAATIPMILSGSDILGNAVTGSGKTAAFLLPIMERILHSSHSIASTKAVVITPTRELAEQIFNVSKGLAYYTNIRTACVVGGVNLRTQETDLRSRPDIIIATPGRLIDHLANSRGFDLETVEILVLDEADRLLEMGFIDEVKQIVKSCPRGRQTLLFSATMNSSVEDLIHLSLKNPKTISVDRKSSIVDTLTQEFIRLRNDSQLAREAIVLSLCTRSFKKRTIIFSRTKAAAHRLKVIFDLNNISAAELHGNLTQPQRNWALQLFKDQKVDFLICTDIAARGIDIKGVQTVINLHMPHDLAQYVHRVGRTARAGNKGISVSIVSEEERPLLKAIMKAARNVIRKRTIAPDMIVKYSDIISNLENMINERLEADKLEKEIKQAEMKATKAENIISHDKEIFSRPARSWFQTEKQKEEIRRKVAESLKAAEAKEKQEDPDSDAQEIDTMESSKKKDPYAGLSRYERRRKMFAKESQKLAADTERRIRESEKAAKTGEGTVMSEKEIKEAKQQVKAILHPEIVAKALKRQAKREEREQLSYEDDDRLGPNALKTRLKEILKKEKIERKRMLEDDTEYIPKKQKLSSSFENRKFAPVEKRAGEGRYKQATDKAAVIQKAQFAAEREARKPKAQTGFKSAKRYKRR